VKRVRDLNFVRTDCYKNLSLFRVTNVNGYRPVAYSLHKNDQDKGVYPYDFAYYENMWPIIVDISPLVSYFYKCGTMWPVMEGEGKVKVALRGLYGTAA
jgi:hypothetical protein